MTQDQDSAAASKTNSNSNANNNHHHHHPIIDPDWLQPYRQNPALVAQDWGEPLVVAEWPNAQEADAKADELDEFDTADEDDNPLNPTTTYRAQHGWQGRDLIHDRFAPVRITEYYVKYGDGAGLPAGMFDSEDNKDATTASTTATATNNAENTESDDQNETKTTNTPRRGGIGTTLTGVAHFTTRAESHKGYCHGGSMCSVLDDVIGWCGFLVTGQCRPWSGFTVQVNTQLKKPIRVHSTLLCQATIVRIERRKVYLEAAIMEPGVVPDAQDRNGGGDDKDDNSPPKHTVHASGEGMVVLNRGVLPELATRGSLHSWPSSGQIT